MHQDLKMRDSAKFSECCSRRGFMRTLISITAFLMLANGAFAQNASNFYWITGDPYIDDHLLLFRADKAVEGNNRGNVLFLAPPKANSNALNVLVEAAKKHARLRIYGELRRETISVPGYQKEVPNVSFLVSKIHDPSDPDDLPDDQKTEMKPDDDVSIALNSIADDPSKPAAAPSSPAANASYYVPTSSAAELPPIDGAYVGGLTDGKAKNNRRMELRITTTGTNSIHGFVMFANGHGDDGLNGSVDYSQGTSFTLGWTNDTGAIEFDGNRLEEALIGTWKLLSGKNGKFSSGTFDLRRQQGARITQTVAQPKLSTSNVTAPYAASAHAYVNPQQCLEYTADFIGHNKTTALATLGDATYKVELFPSGTTVVTSPSGNSYTHKDGVDGWVNAQGLPVSRESVATEESVAALIDSLFSVPRHRDASEGDLVWRIRPTPTNALGTYPTYARSCEHPKENVFYPIFQFVRPNGSPESNLLLSAVYATASGPNGNVPFVVKFNFTISANPLDNSTNVISPPVASVPTDIPPAMADIEAHIQAYSSAFPKDQPATTYIGTLNKQSTNQ